MTLAERLLQQGRLEGQRDFLLRLVRVRFGAPAPDVEARMRAADEPTVQSWAAAILTAGSIDAAIAPREP